MSSLVSSAQYNYYRLSVGVGGGFTRYFGDVEHKPRLQSSITANFDYNLTPFVSAGIEIQKGNISAGDSISDPHLRFFKNSYTAIIANGKIQLGQIANIDYSNFLYSIRGLYLGTGVGVVMNNQSEIKRTKINPGGQPYTFPGKDKSMELLVPANIGINFNFEDYWGYTRFVVTLNHQFNVAFGENLDGYADPQTKFKNNSPDMFGITSIGIKYTFGPEGIF